MITRLFIFLALTASAIGQTFNQAVTLTNLLTKAPVVGGLYSVRGYRVDGDWGNARQAMHVPGSTATTNLGNTFTLGTGRLIFTDRTNTVQDMRWWGGTTASADCTAALTNAANHVYALGGGYVYAPGATYTFLSGGIVMSSGVRLIGDGPNATIFDFTSSTPAYDYENVISWVGTADNTVKLHSVPTAGDRSIVLSSVVTWAAGDWLQLSDTNEFSFGSRNYYHQGEFNFVYSTTGGTNIALLEPLEAAYPTATTAINKITPTVGSAEGIHFALATKSGPVRLAYADSRSYFKNCSAAGTEDTHFLVDSCYGVTVDGVSVDSDSDPSVGLNYGLVYGDSEYLVIQNCFLRSARHGIASGGSSIPTRYCRIVNSTFGSTRQNVAGADMHGDTVECTYDGCTFLSGLTLGGGRNRVLNSTILNGRGIAGIATGECYYYDWEVRGNRFLLSSFDNESQTVWAMRFYLQAGNQSGQPASTNYWPGTWGGTSGQTIKIIDNEIQFTGIRTNGNYGVFIDEASTVVANTNLTAADFGGVIITGNRIIPAQDQPFAQDDSSGIYIYTRDKIRFRNISIENNPLLYSASPVLRVHTGNVSVRGNTFRDLLNKEGVIVNPPDVGTVYGTLDVDISNNLFDRPIGSAAVVAGTEGKVVMRGNRVLNHGSINVTYSRFALAAYDTADPISSVELYDNYVSSTNTSYDVYVSTAAGTLRDESTQIGGSTTTGVRSAGGGYIRAPFLANAYGSTNAIALLGQYTALPTASSYPPGLAHSAGDLWYSDGVTWTNFLHRGTTNFSMINVTGSITSGSLITGQINSTGPAVITNSLDARDLRANTLTIGDTWPVTTNGAVLSTSPIYAQSNTNALMQAQVINTSTGSASGASYSVYSYYQSEGRFIANSTNNLSANAAARVGVYSIVGKGLQFDLLYPTSMDLVFTYGNGTEFARLSTNELYLATPTIRAKAPVTVSPTHFLVTANDPDADPRTQQSFAVASLDTLLDADLQIIAAFTGASNLVTSGDFTGHYHSADRARANHTGTQAISTVISLQSELDLRQLTNAHLTSISGLATNGIMARTASGTVVTRHLVAGTGLSVSDGDGVSGNPTASLANTAVTPGSYTSANITVDAQGRLTSAANGSGGGGDGNRVSGTTGSLDGVTNFAFSVDPSTPMSIAVSGTPPSASIDFALTGAPLLINGTSQTWTTPWNLNSTTPAAPSNHENVTLQVSSTNASGYVKARTTTLTSQRAQEGEPPASNYATFSTRNSIGVMLFDQTVQENLRFRWCLPANYSVTNSTVVIKWTTTATSGDARWGAQHMVLTGDIDSDSFTTGSEGTTTTSGTSGTVMTTTLTGVSLDGAVAGDWVWTDIYRDVGDAADTIAADLELHSIEVRAE